MNFFWEHGYKAASMKDLLAAMEIGRQSLYDTFGDKRGLFLAALNLYYQRGVDSVIATLRDPDGGLAAMEAYFEMMHKNMCAQPCRSCLIINTASELGSHDPEVTAIVNRFINKLQGAFSTALEIAQARGEVRVDDVDGTAWNLTNSAMGFGPMSKADISSDVLKGVAGEVLDAIRA